MTRIGIFVLILVGTLLSSSSRAAAQACTLGPFTSATSLGSIDSTIDSASDGEVVCLRRGQTWSNTGGAAFTLSTGHPDLNRVTICSSDSTQCTDSKASGANAKITMTDSGETSAIKFTTSGGGYTIKNIDFTGANTCQSDDHGDGDGAHGQLPTGLQNVTFEGGVYDGWLRMALMPYASPGGEVSNMKWGTCNNRMEIRNCGQGAQPRWTWYGACDNCGFSAWIHNYGPTSPDTNGQARILDLVGDNNVGSDNVTVECNLWEFDDGHKGGGTVIRFQDGTNAIVRDNTFRRLPGGTNPNAAPQVGGIDFAQHNDAQTPCWDGAEVYSNTFAFGEGAISGVAVRNGRNIKFFNNIFDQTDKVVDPEYWGQAFHIEPHPTCPPTNVSFYNNTIYRPATNTRAFNAVKACAGASCGSGHKLYNNIIWLATPPTPDGAQPVLIDDCNTFGTNGVNISNNFVYTPNDSTPLLPNCSASLPDTATNGFCSNSGCTSSGSWSTAPGFVDAAAGDFRLTSTAPAAGLGAFGGGTGPSPSPSPSPTPTPPPASPEPPAAPILLP